MRRRLAVKLAAMALMAGALAAPARAEVVNTPMFLAQAVTAQGQNIGLVRVQLDYDQGRFRFGGQSWAHHYQFNIDFLSNEEAFLTGVQAHTCGHAYALDPFAADLTWSTSPYVDGTSRSANYNVGEGNPGLEGYTGTTFTAYSNAEPQAGRVTLTGVVKKGGQWHNWNADVNALTMGCVEVAAPADPQLEIGVSASANPVGTGEAVSAAIRVDNTGGYVAENVRVTLDPVAHARYVAGSTTIDGASVADEGGANPLGAGVVVSIPAGGSVTVAQSMSVDRGTGAQGLEFAAHAMLEGFETANGGLAVDTFERSPRIGLSIASSKEMIGTGEVLTATLSVSNSGNEDASGVTVSLDGIANATIIPNSTTLNGAAVTDVGGTSALASGIVVDVPQGGTVTIVCALLVKTGTGGQPVQLAGHAALTGHPTADASYTVRTFETVIVPEEVEPTLPELLAGLKAAIEKARVDGAYRFRVNGYPKFNSLYTAVEKAIAKKDTRGAKKELERIVYHATWTGRYDTWPELFVKQKAHYAKAIENAAKAVLAEL